MGIRGYKDRQQTEAIETPSRRRIGRERGREGEREGDREIGEAYLQLGRTAKCITSTHPSLNRS